MPNIIITDNINVSEQADIGNFVKRVGAQFIYNNARLRFAGVNHYQTMVSGMSQADLATLFAECAALHIPAVRTWAFDTGTNGPLHQLTYPITGTNLITNPSFETDTNGYVLSADFTRTSTDSRTGSWSIKQVSGFNTFNAMSYELTVAPNTDYVWSFYYKLTNVGGQQNQLPPLITVKQADNSTTIKDASFLSNTTAWKLFQVAFNSGSNSQININIQNFGGNNTAFYDDFNVELAPTPVLQTIESGYQQLDLVLDEARKAGVKLILSLVDGNEFNFNGKHTFVSWTNSLNPGANITDSYPYSAFFTDSRVQAIYQQCYNDLITRKNTINGRMYVSDDTIFSIEEGNELRYNSGDANINTLNSSVLAAISFSGGWADIMSTYFKSKDPNHLVGYGDMSHTWQFVGGDWVSNGTFYGADYDYLTRLANIDYLDFHLYPNQSNGGEIHIFGVRFGFSSVTPTAGGLIAQIQDYVNVGKANGKPVICGEVGYVREEIASNAVITQYPRLKAFELIMNTLYAAGGDGVLIWNAEISDADSYTFNVANTWNGNTSNLNENDIPLCNIVFALNTQGTFIVPANALVGDGMTTSESTIAQFNKYLLSFTDNITVEEYVSEINKPLGVEYKSLFEGAQIAEVVTPSPTDNVNLGLIINGPVIH